MRLKEKILSKEGSSLVAVIIVLFIFITLTSSLLMLSIENMNRSKKIEAINSGYYDLDRAIEKTLLQLDNNFEDAEIKAITYIKDQKYKSQGIKVDDILRFKKESKASFFYNRWKGNVDKASNGGNDMEKHNKCLDKFCTEAFGRLYYAYLEEILDEYKYSKIQPIEIDKDNKVDIRINVKKNKNYESLNAASVWEDFKPEEKDFEIIIEAVNSKGKKISAVVRPMIPVYNIVKKEEKGDGVKGNPIYSNAITAGGGIVFKNNCTIEGDIYSANTKGIAVKDSEVCVNGNVYSNGDLCTDSVKGTKSKININRYTNSNNIKKSIFQNNVFLSKDIIETIELDKYGEEQSSSYKDVNTFFIFNDSKGGNVYCNNMIMNNSARAESNISIKGNASTKGSVINDSLYGGTRINIDGNYIGITSYTAEPYIDIYGYEHGTAIRNNNYGSYVENNIYGIKDKELCSVPPNSIRLGGKFIVPGIKPLITAIAQPLYSPQNDITGKLQSFESISCNFWDDRYDLILNAYSVSYFNRFYGNAFVFKQVEERGSKNIKQETLKPRSVIDFYDESQVKESFISYMNGTPSYYSAKDKKSIDVIDTRIEYTEPEGYCATSVLLSKVNKGKLFLGEELNWPSLDKSKIGFVKNNESNKTAYENLKDSLKNIFEAKTVHFGTKDKSFANSVNASVISGKEETETGVIYLSESKNNLEILGNQSGIVYSKGNLNIKGSGTFNGTIICEGDVNINGAVTINYDEGVIKEKLESYKAARNFFEPGEMGTEITYLPLTKVVENSADKKSFKRYKIINWKQGVQ